MTARTLSRWVDRLLKGPVTIECPKMQILGKDHEPPVFTGPGQIEIGADTHMRFVMHATPRDGSDAFRRIIRAQNNPYNVFDQFRMEAVGYDGTKWSGGWTTLQIGEEAENVWRLSGPISHLHTFANGFGVSDKSSVELVYDQPLRLPTPLNMTKTVHRGEKQVLLSRSAGSKTVRVLDTDIEFFHSPEHEHVWALADTTPNFPHPHLENWISEPLCLLLGQLIFPRLTARNFGNGTAHISLHSGSKRSAITLSASILREDPLATDERFWSLYRDILAMVATAKDSLGGRNFEAHPLTQYYREIIQAAKGSNWVLCMTLASTVEGLVKKMFSEAERKSDWKESEVESLRKNIGEWNDNNDLRSIVLNYLNGFKMKGIAKTLKSLVREGTITANQVDAWSKIRNSSMHGEMVMPWSDEEQDVRIENLIELTHRLSEAYIKRELGKQIA